MSPVIVALVAETEREIADRFEHYGIPDANDKATALIRWMQGKGWRVHPALADKPSPGHIAPASVAQAAVAEIRGVLADKAGHRPELAGGCNCRGCVGGAA